MARRKIELIIKIVFPDRVILFGNSYKEWTDQVEEYMRICGEGLLRPTEVYVSESNWIAWGGLKWSSEESFQEQLNREGCQTDDPDNQNPRQYKDMVFMQADSATFGKIIGYWTSGQRLLKINALSDKDYSRYQRGQIKIVVE